MSNTQTTNKTQTNKNIPELRFPGFEGDWVEKKFGEILQLILRPFKMKDDDDYSLVTVKRRYGGIVSRGIYKGKDILVKSQFLLKENDFLISKRQISHNACGIVPKQFEDSIVSNEYSVLIPIDDLNINYFNYFCHLPKVSRKFYLSSTGVHIEKMIFKVDDWFKWSFLFPTDKEQQKITLFLKTVDTKITLLTKKKELMEQYKKGIMQKIFSQEIRFKDDDGDYYPDWEELCFSDRFITVPTNSLSRDFLNYEKGSVFNIHYGDIHTKFDSMFYLKNEYVPFVNEGKLNGNVILCRKGDIIIADASEDYADIGKSIEIISTDDQDLVAGLHTIHAQPIQKVACGFMAYCMKSRSFRLQVMKIAQGTKVLGLSSNRLKNIKYKEPYVDEQQKIATFLSSLDIKISTIVKELKSIQEFKKGLLQKMFI